jgi:hypothetical protein
MGHGTGTGQKIGQNQSYDFTLSLGQKGYYYKGRGWMGGGLKPLPLVVVVVKSEIRRWVK